MDEIFGKENFRNEIVVKRGAPKAGLISQFKDFRAMTTAYDNLYWYSKNEKTRFSGFYKEAPETKRNLVSGLISKKEMLMIDQQ